MYRLAQPLYEAAPRAAGLGLFENAGINPLSWGWQEWGVCFLAFAATRYAMKAQRRRRRVAHIRRQLA